MAKTLLARVSSAASAYRDVLEELSQAAPELLKDRQESHENLQGILERMRAQAEWLERRLLSASSPAPIATDAGLERRRAALAKAEEDGNEAEMARLRDQIAALETKE